MSPSKIFALGKPARHRQRSRLTAWAAISVAAVVLICACFAPPASSSSGAGTGFLPGLAPKSSQLQEQELEWSRRSAVAAAGVILSDVHGSLPAEAILGLFEGKAMVPYTLSDVYNISMPKDYKVKKRLPNAIAWQGDRIQYLEVMSAEVKETRARSLAEVLGANATEVGLRLANERPGVRANSTVKAELIEALVDPQEQGLDLYQFEFLSDYVHELQLVAILDLKGKRYLCAVGLRTQRLLWVERQDTFKAILATFTPLEPQPNKTAASR